MKTALGLALVAVAYWFATRKKDPAQKVTEINFTDEEAGEIHVDAPASTLVLRPTVAPIAAGVMGADAHRTGVEL